MILHIDANIYSINDYLLTYIKKNGEKVFFEPINKILRYSKSLCEKMDIYDKEWGRIFQISKANNSTFQSMRDSKIYIFKKESMSFNGLPNALKHFSI